MPHGPAGEIALTDQFQQKMIEARKRRGWSQSELARRIGISQPAVSNIEEGRASSSRYVLSICEVLEIDPPIHVRDQALAEWLEAGGRLLRANPALFRSTLSMIGVAAPDEDREPEENFTDMSPATGKPSK
jgi:transcriptional regulator with XRE-family HTH domain